MSTLLGHAAVETIITSDGSTLLGADDKAGIAEVLEALRNAPVRPPIELAVSRQEEVGLLGVKAMTEITLDYLGASE